MLKILKEIKNSNKNMKKISKKYYIYVDFQLNKKQKKIDKYGLKIKKFFIN